MKRLFALLVCYLFPAVLLGSSSVGAQVGGTLAPDGKTEIACDLPESLHLKNVGGSDGAGLCLIADTPIDTRTGRVAICRLRPGRDEIAYHANDGTVKYTAKFAVKKTGASKSFRLLTVNGNSVWATPDHPVAVHSDVGMRGRAYGYSTAKSVASGDRVKCRDGNQVVAARVDRAGVKNFFVARDVWDIQLLADDPYGGEGNFFANGLLVHNCVFTSISHSARWQEVPVLQDFRDWMRKHPGGGYPEKVDRMINQVCKERKAVKPDYIQVENDDLEILKLACQSGRMPAVTYSCSPTGRYGGGKIAHMVSLVSADDHWFCVLDNNFPGAKNYEWMTPQEFRRSYTGGRGAGWAVIFLSPGPAPVPHN